MSSRVGGGLTRTFSVIACSMTQSHVLSKSEISKTFTKKTIQMFPLVLFLKKYSFKQSVFAINNVLVKFFLYLKLSGKEGGATTLLLPGS